MNEEGRTLLSIVVPMHNEEQGLDAFFGRLTPVLEAVDCDYEIIAVDDGSRDRTYELLQAVQERMACLKVLKLSRNFGKECAMMAGIEHARGDAVIPIDADLQDPPEILPEMVARWREGYQVVYARRRSRANDSFGKRTSAFWFYRIYNWMATVPIPSDAGDFRLLDRVAVDAFLRLGENNRFTKGLFAWIGFRHTYVDFERQEREQGYTKWSPWKLWNFALDGITAFTTAPLRIWAYLGAIIAIGAIAFAAYLFIQTLVSGTEVPGYASIMVVILTIGGIQLIGIGVIGEYLGRVYLETKRRPLYILEKRLGFEEPKGSQHDEG